MSYREYKEHEPMPPRDEMKLFVREQVRETFKRRYESVDLYHAAGRFAATDIVAQTVLPKLPVSKMDGIAVRFDDFAEGMPNTQEWQEHGEYIFANTGCVVPDEYDTVILIEDVRFEQGKLRILQVPQQRGQLIDPPGSLIGKNEVLVRKNEKITPPLLGLLASGGVKEVCVWARPKIVFLPTGDELVSWQENNYPLDKNVESNSMMLYGFAQEYQADLEVYPIVPDDKQAIKEALTKACETADIVLINAGSSKGTKDFNLDLLEAEGEVLVYELGCRPGKHSSFSLFHHKPVLGIAGPPNGAELAMRFYLKSIINEYYNQADKSINTVQVKIEFDFTAPQNADFCLQVHVYKVEGHYCAQMINPKAVTRSVLLHEYNAFIYLLKGCSLQEGDTAIAELLVNERDITDKALVI